MALDRDGKLRGPTYPGGPTPERSSDDLPRWAFILVVSLGFTLLLALLRFAIDLLGVVFLIILVGFSIRTVGDWLTEGESVSAWTLSAVSTGLIGSMLVGLWVFSSAGVSGTTITDRLPPPVVAGMHWLDARGWGQRVLLSRPGRVNAKGDMLAVGAPSGMAAPSIPSGSTGSPASPASESVSELRQLPSIHLPARSRRDPTEAEAATLEAGAAVASTPPSVDIRTTVTLAIWPVPAVVGNSVRLTATVAAAGGAAPTGSVTFSSDGTPLGSVPVTATRPGRSEAALVTLVLPVGSHEVSAQFTGTSGFASGQSSPLALAVVRK